MARQLEIEWNHSGFEEILSSAGTMSVVQSTTSTIKERANANNTHGGKGFYSGTKIGRAFGSERALGFVYSSDRKSAIAESEDKALSRAVSG